MLLKRWIITLTRHSASASSILIGHMLLFVDAHGRKQCVKTMHGCSKEAKKKLGWVMLTCELWHVWQSGCQHKFLQSRKILSHWKRQTDAFVTNWTLDHISCLTQMQDQHFWSEHVFFCVAKWILGPISTERSVVTRETLKCQILAVSQHVFWWLGLFKETVKRFSPFYDI